MYVERGKPSSCRGSAVSVVSALPASEAHPQPGGRHAVLRPQACIPEALLPGALLWLQRPCCAWLGCPSHPLPSCCRRIAPVMPMKTHSLRAGFATGEGGAAVCTAHLLCAVLATAADMGSPPPGSLHYVLRFWRLQGVHTCAFWLWALLAQPLHHHQDQGHPPSALSGSSTSHPRTQQLCCRRSSCPWQH